MAPGLPWAERVLCQGGERTNRAAPPGWVRCRLSAALSSFVVAAQERGHSLPTMLLLHAATISCSHVRRTRSLPPHSLSLIDEKVRDATQATPSHSHLMTYWSEQGFLPKDQPLALQGDCLPRAVMLALKPSFDKLFKKTKLTIELITSLCGTTPEMSVPELLPFLEKYRISLFVYDPCSSALCPTHARAKATRLSSP